MSIPSPVRSALLPAAVILAATGCDSHPFAGSERDTPRRDGPLDELTYPGGVSINRPAHAGEEWAGSFGCLALCLDKDSAEARIERVRVLETEGTVQDLTAYVATPEEGHRGDLLFISTRDAPPSSPNLTPRGAPPMPAATPSPPRKAPPCGPPADSRGRSPTLHSPSAPTGEAAA
jgi:hypothetical protein